MGRRARFGAVVGGLLLIALAVFPAAGEAPEGDGTTLDVTPSLSLAGGATVEVAGAGFFVDTSIPPTSGTLRQCVYVAEGCGAPVTFPFSGGSTFDTTFTVAAAVTVGGTSYPCVPDACYLEAEVDGLFATHTLNFAATTTTTAPPVTAPPVVTTLAPPTTVTIPTATTTPPTTTATSTTIRTTTTRPTSTTRVTVPPTTRPTPTTQAPPTTTPVVTTSPPPPPPPPEDPPSSLVALTPDKRPSGPPGSGLEVSGTGYTCDTVYFFFDGTRVGSDAPDGAGNASREGLSVPGNAKAGRHEVTSSCEASGDTVMQASFFEVLPASLHRPAFVTAMPGPADITLDPNQLMASAMIATGLILLIAFPYELFNSTMEENYDEIRGWFGLPPRDPAGFKLRQSRLAFVVLTILTAVACGFLSPDFGLNLTSVALVVGMSVGLFVMAVVFSLPADIGIHRRTGEWGKLNFLPGSLIVSIVLVLLSRLLDFQPGYFYGALAGLAFFSALSRAEQGKMTAANWLFSLAVSVGAFFLRAPVSAAADGADPSLWLIALEACLALIFLWGVEGLAVAMLPIRFLDGRKVMGWSRAAWAGMFFLGLFATIHVLLTPGSGYVGETSGGVSVAVMVLYAVFGVGSVAFWAYFRYRPSRWAGPVGAQG